MDNIIAKLYASQKTVVTTEDLAMLWEENNPNNLKAKIAYYVKQGLLIRLTRGIFAKNKSFNSYELATSVYTPAYISFETVLRDSGMIFQHYDTIFVASHLSKTTHIAETTLTFRKLKAEVLYNPTGIINKNGFSIASPERAFLDTLYLLPRFGFDNLARLDWNVCLGLVKIYKNAQLVKRLVSYQKKYA